MKIVSVSKILKTANASLLSFVNSELLGHVENSASNIQKCHSDCPTL